MDASQFDSLARSFAAAESRRGLVRLLATFPVVGILATLLGDENTAGRRRHVDQRRADRRGQVQDQGKNRRQKRKKKCSKIGRTPRKGKPCCKGLVRDGARRCARRCDVCPRGCQFASVQAAIDVSTAGDTISVCAGTYVGNITIAKGLTIIGVGDGADDAGNTILRGTGSGRVVDINNLAATVTLQSLRITGGSATENGGGIRNNAAFLTLTDCTVTGNSATNGAGIASTGDTMTMSGCTISSNTVTIAGGNGGGIANNGGDMTLTECAVTGNTALSQGGGIISGSGTATLTLVSSSVTTNHASSDGGGIANFGTVSCSGDSTVSANTKGNPPEPSNCDDLGSGTGCNSCTL